MGQKLIELVGEWKEVADLISDPDVDEQTVIDTLESIEGAIEVKADGYGSVIRSLEFETAALKGKEEYVKSILNDIAAEKKRIQGHIDWMKNRLVDALTEIGKDKEGIKTDKFEFKVRTAGGVQTLACTEDVPDSFKKVIYENDNDRIREYLKDHEVEWAKLLPRKRSLTMKGV